MARVLILPHMLHNVQGSFRKILEDAGLQAVFPPGGLGLNDEILLAAHLDGVQAVIAGNEPFTDEVLAGSHLRVIARMGIGCQNIDLDAATAHNIAVTITPGVNDVSVAEHTLALMLGVLRGLPSRGHEVRSEHWVREPLPRLAGKTLGIVGLGRIGTTLVPRAQALGLNVIYYDPALDESRGAEFNVQVVDFERLLADSDIISLHCPATHKTKLMFDADVLSKMKVGSVLINTAWGGAVDEHALADAVRRGHLLGAGLDVFQQEPLPKSSPLTGLDNVVLTPHMAGLDDESEVAMSQMAAESIVRLYQGDWPEGCVANETLRPNWTW